MNPKCTACKCYWEPASDDVKSSGLPYKTCKKCRNRDKTYREKAKCKHKILKRFCKVCKGSSICKHNCVKRFCKKCKGVDICKHNKRKNECVECKGKNICKHNKRKRYCAKCKGQAVCKHGRDKYKCKECKGGCICKHNKVRSKCRECKGGSICQHNKNRITCKDCNGSAICKHNRIKYSCKKCKGSAICFHDKAKTTCVICYPKCACKNCLMVYANYKQNRFKPYCFRCFCILNPDVDIPRKYMLKEHHLRQALKDKYKNIKLVFNKTVDNGCSQYRPDVRIECLTHSIIIECDENQHLNYVCENKRMMTLFRDLGNRPLVLIRFNPDSYVLGGIKQKGCFKTRGQTLKIREKEWQLRLTKLIKKIDKYLSKIPKKEIKEIKLFYDQL